MPIAATGQAVLLVALDMLELLCHRQHSLRDHLPDSACAVAVDSEGRCDLSAAMQVLHEPVSDRIPGH